ncbi:MAG: DUF4013 domain-containing protein [Opitutales bacterium]|jgi:hypothetical protein|nr:DUF4013 domain-containing protein [Opitutales bacterium]MDP4643514.1 DUF4013 domain-containing protein [Opitutales bacterium]MDP4778123.1 DUF4013 domain-containing protein [Opitutales bacterium]MDP4883210.1 DUF4013 domain-containing protein [Opitutales bacterium]
MKETPIFEEVFMRLIRQPGFGLKLLIGGLLSFVPVLNLFAFGYLYRFSKQTRATGRVILQEWGDWKGLFFDGLRFAVVWLAYWLLPIIIALVLSSLLRQVGLGAIAFLIFSVVFLLSPVLFSSALYRLQMRSDFKDLLDVVLIVRMSYMEFSRFLIPALTFLGIFTLLAPLYGFAVFFGFMMLIAYTAVCYRAIEQGGRPASL